MFSTSSDSMHPVLDFQEKKPFNNSTVIMIYAVSFKKYTLIRLRKFLPISKIFPTFNWISNNDWISTNKELLLWDVCDKCIFRFYKILCILVTHSGTYTDEMMWC